MLNKRYQSVATLGDPDNPYTCSMIVLNALNITNEVHGCPNFEDAASQVKTGDSSAMLVPAAYPNVAPLIQDDELKLEEVPVHPIPKIVFASFVPLYKYQTLYLYYHKATESLLEKVYEDFADLRFKLVPVDSNVEACEKHLANLENSVAVTNASCAKRYALDTYAELNHGVDMPWLIFSKNDSINEDS